MFTQHNTNTMNNLSCGWFVDNMLLCLFSCDVLNNVHNIQCCVVQFSGVRCPTVQCTHCSIQCTALHPTEKCTEHYTAPQLLIVLCGCEGSGGEVAVQAKYIKLFTILHSAPKGNRAWIAQIPGKWNYKLDLTIWSWALRVESSLSMGNDFMRAYCTCWHGKRLGGGDRDYRLVT